MWISLQSHKKSMRRSHLNKEIEKLIKIAKKLLSSILIILFSTVFSFLLGCLFTMDTPDNLYMAQVSLYTTGSYKDTQQTTSVVKDYLKIVESTKVATNASTSLKNSIPADEIRSMVQSDYIEGSAIFTISAYSSNPDECILISNVVAEEFLIELKNVTRMDNVRILDRATVSTKLVDGKTSQISTRIQVSMVGCFLCMLIIVIKELFSNKINSIGMTSLDGEIKIIGVIPDSDI